MSDRSLTYRDAGVDIDAGNALVERIKPLVKRTHRPEVMSGLGGFGGLCSIPSKYSEPVLVSGTDGVGTKLRLAIDTGIHNTVGIDLVAMCVNDLIVQGAEPLFFLDYFATAKLDVNAAASVIEGIAKGCELAGCALIGGETAEMPGMYQADDYDLAGFCVGVVEKSHIIDGTQVKPGQSILALSSSGPHSNGFSLIRKIIEQSGADLKTRIADTTLADHLLEPTKIYVKSILALMQSIDIKAISHITGGGLLENIPRVLPEHTTATIDTNTWEMPEIFQWLQKQGNIDSNEMYRTFNCGIGMVLCIDQNDVERAIALLESFGEDAFCIGTINTAREKSPGVILQV